MLKAKESFVLLRRSAYLFKTPLRLFTLETNIDIDELNMKEIQEGIFNNLKENQVTVYIRHGDQHTKEVEDMLQNKNIQLKEINLDQDLFNGFPIRHALLEYTGKNISPYIFFGYKFIGGMKELKRMQERGELDRYIQEAQRGAKESREERQDTRKF